MSIEDLSIFHLDSGLPDLESGVQHVDAVHPSRVIAFPPGEDEIIEEKPYGGLRPHKAAEMRREMTREDKELAEAGYEIHHLHDEKDKKQSGGKGSGPNKKDTELGDVDIREHQLTFAALAAELQTSMDPKDASASRGLLATEVEARLARDGKNQLSPPKKKSALRKVGSGRSLYLFPTSCGIFALRRCLLRWHRISMLITPWLLTVL